jgi:single-stranded-DNA-specific exonuclease
MINTHVINPQLGYGYKYLSGVGTVLSFILNIADTLNKKINEDYYAFASIGTIADLMPLNDINRHLVIKGLDILNKTNNMGLALLLNKLSLEDKTINAYDVAFKIAPRINAAGRMDHAYRALELFINPREKIAQELMELNLKRQETEEYVLNNILNSIDLEQDIIIGYGSSLNDGVIGIVASRLVDKFKKPVIVFNLDNGIAKGSARSYGEIDLFNELSKFKSFFEKFGGHSQAAGLSIKEENFFSFKKKIEEYFSKEIPQWMKIQKIYYVDSVNAKEITIENVLELNILEPFGMGNLKPLFRFGPMNVENSKTIGKNNEHLSIKFSFDNATFNGVYFNYKDNSLKSNSIIECLGYLEINDFKGIKSIQIIIKDLIIDYKPSKINENELEKKIINYFKERKKVKGTLAIISKKFSLDETSTKSLLLNLQSNGFIEIQEKDGELFIISLDK